MLATKISNYILLRCLNIWIQVALIMSALYLLISQLELYKISSNRNIDFFSLVLMSFYKLPNIILQYPIVHGSAALFLAFWSMRNSGEILAIRTLGLAPIRLILALGLRMLLVGVLLTILLSTFAAFCSGKLQELHNELYSSAGIRHFVSGGGVWQRFQQGENLTIIRVASIDQESNTLHDISVYQLAEDSTFLALYQVDNIVVDRGEWVLNRIKLTQSGKREIYLPSLVWDAPFSIERINEGFTTPAATSVFAMPQTIADLSRSGLPTTEFLTAAAFLFSIPVILVAILTWVLAIVIYSSSRRSITIWPPIVLLIVGSVVFAYLNRLLTATQVNTFTEALFAACTTPMLALGLGVLLLLRVQR